MTFSEAVRICFRKYFTFSGRATRPEYWWFVLFLFLGSFVAGFCDSLLFGPVTETGVRTDLMTGEQTAFTRTAYGEGPISSVFSLATLIPALSSGWRRMHDTGRSGLHLLYPLIVLVGLGTAGSLLGGIGAIGEGGLTGVAAVLMGFGLIVFIVSPLIVIWWLTRPTQKGANQYGPNPHGVFQ